MSKSPGHQKWPQHRVDERRVDGTVTVQIDGDVLAQSRNVIRVDEEEYPPRYYLPRDDVKMDKLERSNTTTECPFKGTAHYFSIAAGDKRLKDAVWSYEEPYDEHRDLKGRLAFYDDKFGDIQVHVAQ